MISIDYRSTPLVDINRADIAGRIAEFLACGGEIQEIPDGVSGFKDSPTFNHALSNPERRAHEKKQSSQFRSHDMSLAIEGHKKAAQLTRVQKSRELRRMAADGMSIQASAKAMGISYNYARRIANENQITFRTQTIKDVADKFCGEGHEQEKAQ